ncbi:hypothetical protein Tco_0706580 [Tanacetum coccineum]|uniref:Uncharacterized protein n=1 Tax=Tanacetum coccineum TaxID=301880 RepID=A0ABQ4Y7S8_9ASTR
MEITAVTLVEKQMSPWKGNLPRLPIESNIVLLVYKTFKRGYELTLTVQENLIDGKSIASESNGFVTQPEIIREVFVKLLLDSFVKLSISYLVVREFDVVHRKNWLLENKDEIGIPTEKELVGFTPRHRIGFRMKFVQGATPIWHRARGVCLTSLEARGLGLMAGELQGEVVRMVTCCGTRLYCLVRKKKVGSWTCVRLSRGGVRVPREDDRGVSEGREDVCEVFQQHRSGAKRKLSRCGRNQMGNELILALPEGADDFIVYYDARTKDLEACLEKGEGDCLYVATTEGEGLSFEYGCASFEAWYGKECRIEVMVLNGFSPWRGVSHLERKDKFETELLGTFEIFGFILGPTVRLRISVYE